MWCYPGEYTWCYSCVHIPGGVNPMRFVYACGATLTHPVYTVNIIIKCDVVCKRRHGKVCVTQESRQRCQIVVLETCSYIKIRNIIYIPGYIFLNIGKLRKTVSRGTQSLFLQSTLSLFNFCSAIRANLPLSHLYY